MRPVTEVTCVDGTVLAVEPVPVLDRAGVPYEVTLRLLRDGAVFGEVGERCGWFLRAALGRLADGTSTLEQGVRAWARDDGLEPEAAWAHLQRYLPRDRELLAFLARDPDDPGAAGELRVWLRSERRWTASGWVVEHRAVLDAWGADGRGVRAVMDRTVLHALLVALVAAVDVVLA